MFSQQPNIVLFVIDDGSEVPITNEWGFTLPNLDRLESGGFSFLNAHVNAALCNPSRSSFLTGKYPSNVNGFSNAQFFNTVWPDVKTLPEHLSDYGYYTAGIGKVFSSFDDAKGTNPPATNRFDYQVEFFDDPGATYPTHGYSDILSVQSNFDWGGIGAEPDNILADTQTADDAISFIQGYGGSQPLFLSVGFKKPHLPWYYPDAHEVPLPNVLPSGYAADDLDDVPVSAYTNTDLWDTITSNGADNTRWFEAIQAYLSAYAYSDYEMGRVYDELLANGYNDSNTIFIWVSDHGFSLGQKKSFGKQDLWNHITRVPFVWRGQGVTAGSTTRVVSLVDLAPTIAQLAQTPPIPTADGRSIGGFLNGLATTRPSPVIIQKGNAFDIDFPRYRYASLTDNWKFVTQGEMDGYTALNLSEELYYYLSDPFELTNRRDDPTWASIESLHRFRLDSHQRRRRPICKDSYQDVAGIYRNYVVAHFEDDLVTNTQNAQHLQDISNDCHNLNQVNDNRKVSGLSNFTGVEWLSGKSLRFDPNKDFAYSITFTPTSLIGDVFRINPRGVGGASFNRQIWVGADGTIDMSGSLLSFPTSIGTQVTLTQTYDSASDLLYTYVDDVLVDTRSPDLSILDSTFSIGGFTGSFTGLTILQKHLTATERTNLYNLHQSL